MKTLFFALALSVVALTSTPLVSVAQSNDIAQIKAVIERQTDSWNKRDAAAYADCWANVPEAGHLVALNDDKHTVISSHDAVTSAKDFIASMGAPSKDTFQNSDYQIRVKNDAAFAQFDQTVTKPDGTKQYLYETRYLEKVGRPDGSGKWKIVHVGAVVYDPGK